MLTDEQVLRVIGRDNPLFLSDLEAHRKQIEAALKGARVLVIGAAGSIGNATTKILASFEPAVLHLLDINENELADLVRQLRVSRTLAAQTDLRTYVLDVNSPGFNLFCRDGRSYDYVFNLSAMKHVRSESNVYSLARMIETNVLSTNRVISELSQNSEFKYFCVSTDKAANPVNLMGVSKLVMENYAFSNEFNVPVSSARFANVAFSNGSLLQSFDRRIEEDQPLVIPQSIKRFFISEAEAGVICVLSGVMAPHRSILVPSETAGLKLIPFEDIVDRYLAEKGFLPEFVDEKSVPVRQELDDKKWPVIVSPVDTTGEKPFEEFVSGNDSLGESPFRDLSVVLKKRVMPELSLLEFETRFNALVHSQDSSKESYVSLLKDTGVDMSYSDLGKYLDDKL
ncbi:polysaccharide biosynthesis protein [Boseongicola aestuarii]|uniref:UDP-N-acetyl-alpha-D-glucosamine C6 dehydratase n=1 Tax=Boseongicola aestuarii TaxID=1470561 RepID=A0A238J648_9RHOB|nr:polysaccharide biosynthesis protein [Boseongicola aestuarii]SMX25364.1 UDP-N-acetyl-alpha-D-glucosamine C6 dehydratase [Boseongicola aestuarii]